jgi:hypothetical protein
MGDSTSTGRDDAVASISGILTGFDARGEGPLSRSLSSKLMSSLSETGLTSAEPVE